MVTRVSLGARVVSSFPLETVVPVDVYSHLHVATVDAHGFLLSAVHVLALQQQLSILLEVVIDLVGAVCIQHWDEEVLVTLQENQFLRVLVD